MRSGRRRGLRCRFRTRDWRDRSGAGIARCFPAAFQFRASGRQRNQGEVVRELELAGGVPCRLVENDQRVRAGCNSQTDLVDMLLHGFGVGMRHDDCNSSIAARTDCAEKISIFVTLILWLARSRALFGPLVDQTVLLSNAHLILEPDLDRRCRCECIHKPLLPERGSFFKSRNRLRILLRGAAGGR